jgi:hypothetical protein
LDSLDKLSNIVIHLCRQILHVRRPGGILTNAFLKRMAHVDDFKDTSITVSDMKRDISPSDTVAILSDGKYISKPVKLTPHPNGTGITTVMSTFSAKSIQNLTGINSYFMINDTHILVAAKLEGTLLLRGLSVFQPYVEVSFYDANRPRLYFKHRKSVKT